MSYDFSQLNDKEFESISTDLLSKLYDKRIERFKPGKDSGVDGRYFSDSNKEIILQCKHYLKSGYKSLITVLKKELIKVKKLDTEKYIFVTSLPLSRNNKKEIKNIFIPYIENDNYIFGQEDLNDILSRYPEIEEKYFKLWISSTVVFNRLINNAIKGRSEFEIEQIRKKSYKYVQTKNHYIALNILSENNVIIISGEPGIGKTTLAENLCLHYVAKDYEFLDIEESLSEAENVYKRGKKQIFYFDDFLGSNYFEAIENKKDSHIIKFIERVKNDKTKKFILTSRTNILNSGILHSSIFSVKKIRKNEFLLTIDELNNFEKAKILYNHLWFSNLSENYISEIYKDKRYHQIIKHNNFNPRLIEFITDIDRISINPEDYWDYILKTLENPIDIWNDCFKNQNNSFVRNLVIITVFNGGQIIEEELIKSYYNLIDIENIRNESHTEKDFNSVAQLSTKSFLNRNILNNKEYYSLFNPSIADFILNEYSKNVQKLINVFKSLYSVRSLETLLSLEKSNIISKTDLNKILNELFLDAIEREKDYDYLVFLSFLFINDSDKKDNIVSILEKIIRMPSEINEFYKFINLLLKFRNSLEIGNYNFLLETFKDRYLNYDEIKILSKFMATYSIYTHNLIIELKEQIREYLSEKINDIKSDLDLSLYIDYYDTFDDDIDLKVDEDSIVQAIIDSLKKEISGINSKIKNKLNINLSEMVDEVEIDELVSEYLQSIEHEPEEYGGYGGNDSFDNDIDDLFERT